MILPAVLLALPLALQPVVEDPSLFKHSLDNPEIAIFVTELASVERGAGTCEGDSGTRLRGRLEVEEVLRGELEPGSYTYCISLAADALDPSLSPGTRLIFIEYVTFTMRQDRALRMQPPFLAYSAETLRIVDRTAFRNSPLQGPLALGVLVLAVVVLVLFVLLVRNRLRRPSLRLAVRLGLFAAAAGAVVCYLSYESLISPYYNIRIDLLVLWPALGLSVVLALVAVFLKSHHSRR